MRDTLAPMRVGVAWLCALLACTGEIGAGADRDAGRDGEIIDPNRPPEATDQGASLALSRLSRRELDDVLQQIFDVDGLAEEYLPADVLAPFDTDTESRGASQVLIDGMEALAFNLARDRSADTAWVDSVAGCTPSDASDVECLRSFATNLGLRAWRRPLTDAELDAAMTPASMFAMERDDPYVGVRFLIGALLQSPEFLYRTLIGQPVDGEPSLRRLDNYELMSRLAFLIWGTMPSDEMLQRAAGAELSDEELIQLADEMLLDPRADAPIEVFHTFWLGYRGLRVPAALEPAMLAETEALLDRVLTDEAVAWTSLFTSTETYVSPELAAHYAMPPISEPGWVSYANEQRAGVLSHASMLSLSSRNGNETSPTIRGKFIATQLLCWSIPEPPADVDTDDPPEATDTTCKSEEYEAHRDASSTCFNCHELMDPIGFGLEQLDGHGVYREVEYGNPSCTIEGVGTLKDVGTFRGPRELAALMIESGDLTACGVRQFVHFATGRLPDTGRDAQMLANLHAAFVDSGEDFRALIRALVAHPAFRHRVEASE